MQIFTQDLTKKLMDEMPEMSLEDARIFAKSNWEGTTMTPQMREPFELQAQEDRERYRREMREIGMLGFDDSREKCSKVKYRNQKKKIQDTVCEKQLARGGIKIPVAPDFKAQKAKHDSEQKGACNNLNDQNNNNLITFLSNQIVPQFQKELAPRITCQKDNSKQFDINQKSEYKLTRRCSSGELSRPPKFMNTSSQIQIKNEYEVKIESDLTNDQKSEVSKFIQNQ